MKRVGVILGVVVALVVLFWGLNLIYRSNTVDNSLEKKIQNGAVILDVRTEKEFRNGHIDGAVNISLGTIRARYIELDSSRTYITYCSHGLRSMKVKMVLEDKGFRHVYNGGAMSDLETVISKAKENR